jgi:membrane protein
MLRIQQLFSKLSQFVVNIFTKCREDMCSIRAAALSFYTILAIVPLLALLFGIANGFGLREKLEELVKERLPGQEFIAEQLILFANKALENAHGGLIAGMGALFLFWTALGVLTNIELALNQIFQAKRRRRFFRKIGDYFAIVFISPFLLVISSSATLLLSNKLAAWYEVFLQHFPSLDWMLSPFAQMFFQFIPLGALWLLFAFLFAIIPNTKVSCLAAIIGAFFAACVFQYWQSLYIELQLSVSTLGIVYGSFSALPLFFAWLYFSWMIFLYSAQIAAVVEGKRAKGESVQNQDEISRPAEDSSD